LVKASICSAKNAQAAAHDAITPAISGMLKSNFHIKNRLDSKQFYHA